MDKELKNLDQYLGELNVNSRIPFYNDDSDYNTNAPSYYDDLARKQKLIKHLALRIWDYDKEILKRLAEWDKNLEEFDDEVMNLLRQWINDGTFEQIINEEIFNDLNTKIQDIYDINVKDYGIISDGQTDQTIALKYLFQEELKDYRGNILIPLNVKFNMSEIYPTIPVGAILHDFSQINMYNSDTYKQKVVTIASSDLVNDDTIWQLVSTHHPAIVLNNMGGSNSTSADRNATSIMYAAGFNEDGTVKSNFINQVYHQLDKWWYTIRILSRYGSDEVIDSSVFSISEDGKLGLNTLAQDANLDVRNSRVDNEKITRIRYRNDSDGSRIINEFVGRDSEGQDIRYTIQLLPSNVLGIFNNQGEELVYFHNDGIEYRSANKLQFTKINGQIPDVSKGYSFVVDNIMPTTMANMTGINTQEVILMFPNENTTIQQGYFRNLSGQDDIPAQNEVRRYIRNTSVSQSWIQV